MSELLDDSLKGLSPEEGHKTSQGALRRLLPKMVADGQANNPRYGVYTPGNSGNSPVTYAEKPIIRGGNTGNTYGNSSVTVTDDKEGGNTLEPILEPTVTGDTAVTANGGKRLTEAETREVQRLISQGMSPKAARTEILAAREGGASA